MEEQNITELGNPGNPAGDYGKKMLADMNERHYDVTTWALSFWSVAESDFVLDIGCGGGRTLSRLSESVVSGKLYGLDYSVTALECCAAYNDADIRSGKMQLVNASVIKMPFQNNYFDKIITVESFYFWPDSVNSLAEVRRILKPDGTFLLTADIYGDADLSEEEQNNVKKYHLINPTKEEFVKMCKAAGFADAVIHTKPGTNYICVEAHK